LFLPTPAPSAGATPVKYAALSFGIERGTAGQAGQAEKYIFWHGLEICLWNSGDWNVFGGRSYEAGLLP